MVNEIQSVGTATLHTRTFEEAPGNRIFWFSLQRGEVTKVALARRPQCLGSRFATQSSTPTRVPPRVYVPSRELFTLLYIRPSVHLPRPVFPLPLVVCISSRVPVPSLYLPHLHVCLIDFLI